MIVERTFNTAYIYLDICFLAFFLILLTVRKKYLGLIFSIFGGILYFVVDYGIFHLLTHSRSIENGDMLLTLLWMSLSYGITNFSIIYFLVKKDKDAIIYCSLIWVWWLCCPLLSSLFSESTKIHISRTTGSYHGVMGLFLVVGYFGLLLYNLFNKNKEYNAPIFKLFIIGFITQFGWELGLLLGGIRSQSYSSFGDKILLMITNSLLETNLGMPYLWLIVLVLSKYFEENLKKIPKENRKSFKEIIKENNEIKYLDLIKRSV